MFLSDDEKKKAASMLQPYRRWHRRTGREEAVYRVKAWRAPNEDGTGRPIRIRCAPADGIPAVTTWRVAP